MGFDRAHPGETPPAGDLGVGEPPPLPTRGRHAWLVLLSRRRLTVVSRFHLPQAIDAGLWAARTLRGRTRSGRLVTSHPGQGGQPSSDSMRVRRSLASKAVPP